MGGKIEEDPVEFDGGTAIDWSDWEDPFWIEGIGTKEWSSRVSEGKDGEDPPRVSFNSEDTSKISSGMVEPEGAELGFRVSMEIEDSDFSDKSVFVCLFKECEYGKWVLRGFEKWVLDFGSKFLGFENWRVLYLCVGGSEEEGIEMCIWNFVSVVVVVR